MSDRFVLRLPPSPEYVGTARIFAGAVARQLGAGEGAVDDLKLAVSELCASGIRDGAGPIRVALEAEEGRIAVEVEGAAEAVEPVPEESTPDSFARSVGLEVVRSLFPDVVASDAGDGRGRVRFEFRPGETG